MRTTTAIVDPHFERPVTGADLVAFQRLVRRVPVAEPVMRYALHARAHEPAEVEAGARIGEEVRGVRRQRPRRAVPGARRQGARADERPLPRELRRHPRAGAPGAAPPRADQLPRRVRRHHDRLDHRRAARRSCRCRSRGCNAMDRCRRTSHDPGRAVRRSDGPRADRQPRAAGAHRRRRLHQRPAPRAVLRRVDRLRRAPRLRRRATTSAASTGGCTRAPIATTSSSTRPTRTRTSRSCSTSRGRWGSAAGASRSSSTAAYLARVPRLPRAAPARPRRHRHVRRRHRRRTCRRRPSTSTSCCTRSTARSAERPGNARRPAQKMARALQAPRPPAC